MPWALPWAYPEYTRQQFNSAAHKLLPMYVMGENPHYIAGVSMSDDEMALVFELIDNWRSSHSYPLNIFQAGLRNRAKQVDERAIVAQRLKRFLSILTKFTAQRTKVTSYSYEDREKAQEDYSRAERRGQSQDVVLVSAENIKALKSAYPNYFLDMRKFIAAVAQAVAPMKVRFFPQQPTLFDKLE